MFVTLLLRWYESRLQSGRSTEAAAAADAAAAAGSTVMLKRTL
jgi:hypothetical protein